MKNKQVENPLEKMEKQLEKIFIIEDKNKTSFHVEKATNNVYINNKIAKLFKELKTKKLQISL